MFQEENIQISIHNNVKKKGKMDTKNKVHEKNDFVEISKNLAKYSSENNFVGL